MTSDQKRNAATLVIMLGAALCVAQVQATPISGTLSNFDTYNTTTDDSDGAELELEGVHSSDVSSHYPSHYRNPVQYVEYDDGVHFGTRVIFDDYFFNGADVLSPSVPQSTNGHTCVNLSGCEHFGFSVTQQPTAVRFFWHDAAGNRINPEPLLIPSPTWVYIPPAIPADPPIIRAIVEVPEVEDPVEMPDSIWMLVTETETEQPTDLEDLVSGGPLAGEIEVETEWELLEGGVQEQHDFEPGDASKSIVRRYDYYEFAGQYTGEHEPITVFDPAIHNSPEDVGELGPFIAANMVAVNLVPEPATVLLGGLALTALALISRSKRRA